MNKEELQNQYDKVMEERRTYMAECAAMGSLMSRRDMKLWKAKIDSCDRRLLKIKYEMKLLEKEVTSNESKEC